MLLAESTKDHSLAVLGFGTHSTSRSLVDLLIISILEQKQQQRSRKFLELPQGFISVQALFYLHIT